MKKTPLYEKHVGLNGRIIDFGGWAMPVEYEGILKEHKQTRQAAGLFDVSHMGEVTVKGPEAEAFIQNLVTNSIAGMGAGQVVYSPMCYPNGGVVDDLLVYKLRDGDYLLVVNAANTDKDFAWIVDNLHGDVAVRNVSDEWGQIAIQGPAAEGILQKLTDKPLSEIAFYHFAEGEKVAGVDAIVSRTGYTGEDGFELYVAAGDAPALWDALLLAGAEDGLVPAGLGARDTLRFEAALPLYGNELSQEITPLEAGLGMFVKLDKENFIGKEALAGQKAAGLKRRVVGFEMAGPGIPRSHQEIVADGQTIGHVTSGTRAPSLEKNMGMALVEAEYAAEGTEFAVVIREKPVAARTVKKPFLPKRYKK